MEKKQRTLNNKGFSLIELIVVIAIMAILVGALAPQYMKFVERSRKSTDVQNVAAIKSALEVYAADPMVATDDALKTGTVTITTTEAPVSDSNATENGNKALNAAGITSLLLKSSKWPDKSSGNITSYALTYTVSPNGTVKFSETELKTGYSILNGKYE